MKRVIISALLLLAAALLSSCAKDHAQQQTALNSPGYVETVDVWPVRFEDSSGTSFTVFEPQCDSWDGHQLEARCAVAVQGPHQPEATYGVFGFSAITLVDKSASTATLANFRITSADFPSARTQTQNYLASLVQNFSKHSPPLTLDHLENAMTVTPPPKADHLNNTPPRVIIASKPAVLVYIDGPPAWRTVPGTDLQRVINTRMLVLKDSAGRCYLHLFDGYLQATSLDGPWTVASQPPAGAAAAEKQATDSGQGDLLPGTPDQVTQKMPSLSTPPVPDVFVATQPAELIQFKGQPEYAPIPDTHLVYASNTSGNVFKSLTDQENYILISGRWYKASSLNGPWQFVPGNELPKDFANIPDSSPKENVKASVPGTRQAEEALIANDIPQSTTVPRTSEMPAPQFDGSVKLAPIEGTPLQYVVNSSTPIIEEDPQSWYSCYEGVWYSSSSANGPWTVATFVPPVIYTIPPSSPLHYVTYVQVYGASTNAVYEGYTPGYMGTEVDEYGTVVYGTGYDYYPWVGTVWYGPPVTWGWGFYDCWSPWWGWGFGYGFGWGWGWGWGWFPPYPYWCGFHQGFWHDRDGRWHGAPGAVVNTSGNVYRHGQFTARGANHGGVNGAGQAYNSRTGWLQAGQRAGVQHVSGAAWQHFAYNQNGGFNQSGARGYGSYPSRGYQTSPGGGWHGGYNWNPPQGRGWSQNPGGAAPGGAARGGGGFHGGGGGGSHGGGGGGGGGHGGGGGGGGGGGHGGR